MITVTAPTILANVIAEVRDLDAEILALSERLSKRKAWRKYLAEHVLGECVETYDLHKRHIVLDGTVVVLERTLQCGVSVARRDEAHAQIMAAGAAHLLGSELTLEFPRDQVTQAHAVASFLDAMGLKHTGVKTTLHGATLRSWVKKRLEAGLPVPEAIDLYNPIIAKPASDA